MEKNKKYMRADLKSKRLETLISNLEQIFFKYHQVLSWWVLQITVFKEMRWFCLNALENKRKIRNLFNKSISKNEIIRIYIEKINSALLIFSTVHCWFCGRVFTAARGAKQQCTVDSQLLRFLAKELFSKRVEQKIDQKILKLKN